MFAQLIRSRGYVFSLAIGQIWLTLVGIILTSTLWGVFPTVTEGIISLIVLGIVGIIFIVADIRFLRMIVRLLPRTKNQSAIRAGKRMGRRFALIVVIEVVVIAAANIVLQVLHRSDLATPVTLLIVGLHFIPLASIFQLFSYMVMGILWMLIVIVTFLVVPSTKLLGSGQIAGWIAIPLIGCGLVTLGVVAITLIQAMRILQASPRTDDTSLETQA